jgi:hypothetical protein
MKHSVFCFALATCLSAPAAFAACEIPSPPTGIPDGTTASESELLAAQSVVQSYVTAMNAYIACENEALTVGGENAAAEFRFQLSTRIDNARAEVDAVATRFNAEVQAFRATRPVNALQPRTTPPPTRPPNSPGSTNLPGSTNPPVSTNPPQ